MDSGIDSQESGIRIKVWLEFGNQRAYWVPSFILEVKYIQYATCSVKNVNMQHLCVEMDVLMNTKRVVALQLDYLIPLFQSNRLEILQLS